MVRFDFPNGMRRSTSLLALLHTCYKDGIDLKSASYAFWESCLAVYAHHVPHDSKIDEAVFQMKVSQRGSVREATNVAQIALIALRLSHYGFPDMGAFVRKYNSQTGQKSQITGRKALSLKFLFEQTAKD